LFDSIDKKTVYVNIPFFYYLHYLTYYTDKLAFTLFPFFCRVAGKIKAGLTEQDETGLLSTLFNFLQRA